MYEDKILNSENLINAYKEAKNIALSTELDTTFLLSSMVVSAYADYWYRYRNKSVQKILNTEMQLAEKDWGKRYMPEEVRETYKLYKESIEGLVESIKYFFNAGVVGIIPAYYNIKNEPYWKSFPYSLKDLFLHIKEFVGDMAGFVKGLVHVSGATGKEIALFYGIKNAFISAGMAYKTLKENWEHALQDMVFFGVVAATPFIALNYISYKLVKNKLKKRIEHNKYTIEKEAKDFLPELIALYISLYPYARITNPNNQIKEFGNALREILGKEDYCKILNKFRKQWKELKEEYEDTARFILYSKEMEPIQKYVFEGTIKNKQKIKEALQK